MVAAFLLLSAQAAQAPLIPAFFTGERLLRICQANSGQCAMYVAGVLDGLFYARSRGGEMLCPSPMTNRDAARIVTEHLEASADARRRAASVAVREALDDRLQCREGTRSGD